MNEKIRNTYHSSEKGHEASIVELIIVQLVCDLCNIGNVVPSQLDLAFVMENRASINARGFIEICRASLSTN